jgi:hypothetical protein
VNFGAIEVVPRKERSSRCDEYILEVVREDKESSNIRRASRREKDCRRKQRAGIIDTKLTSSPNAWRATSSKLA